MCHSAGLSPAVLVARGGSLGRLDHPLLVRRTFPTLSLRILPCVLGPLPRQRMGCLYPFLPPHHRPSPPQDPFGASHHPVQRLQHRAVFAASTPFLMFMP